MGVHTEEEIFDSYENSYRKSRNEVPNDLTAKLDDVINEEGKGTKEDDKYVVEQPTEEVLQKIHGIYNYEMN